MTHSDQTYTPNPGEQLSGFTRLIPQERINAYADASGDHNPIHLDDNFARQTRFGQRIAHGMLSLAFVWEMLAINFPDTWHKGTNVKVRFTAPVLPGEKVQVGGSVENIRTTNNRQFLQCKIFVNRPDKTPALSGTALIPIKPL